MRYIFQDMVDWDVFSLSVVAGSDTEKLLLQTATENTCVYRKVSEFPIPYIDLSKPWTEYFDGLRKKFRYTIRSGDKQLRSLGELKSVTFTDPASCEEYLRHVYTIERNSWKEDRRTSITSNPTQSEFHKKLAFLAATDRLLRGYVLFLNGQPIAHIFGLRVGQTFFDLKESYNEAYGENSPGAVLKAHAIQDLISENVRFWDFVGPAEFHKLRWTSLTYVQRTYSVFSRRAKGRSLQFRHDFAKRLRTLKLLKPKRDDFGRRG
jgi:CelD/BcsL family acetyltransferase involved in cellulose biosynthesis